MKAVDPLLVSTIKELQQLPSLNSFMLAGGTNLALLYNHRVSYDIDLVSNNIIGNVGFEKIISEVASLYGSKKIIVNKINTELDGQFNFLRLFITKSETIIKIELLQNIQYLTEPDEFDGMRILSKQDIGLLKLMSASNRFAKKDIYDLDYITDEIPLGELVSLLQIKSEKYNKPQHRNIFELDNEISPQTRPELLLEFDKRKYSKNKPFHSNNRIDIIEGSKSWQEARISWRFKVRKLFQDLGLEFPSSGG